MASNNPATAALPSPKIFLCRKIIASVTMAETIVNTMVMSAGAPKKITPAKAAGNKATSTSIITL